MNLSKIMKQTRHSTTYQITERQLNGEELHVLKQLCKREAYNKHNLNTMEGLNTHTNTFATVGQRVSAVSTTHHYKEDFLAPPTECPEAGTESNIVYVVHNTIIHANTAHNK